MKTCVLKISYRAGNVPCVEPRWSSTWAEIPPKCAQCWSQVGPKLEPSGSKLGRSWGPKLRPCWIEMENLDDVAPICNMCKLPTVQCTFWQLVRVPPPAEACSSWTDLFAASAAKYHASAPRPRLLPPKRCNKGYRHTTTLGLDVSKIYRLVVVV